MCFKIVLPALTPVSDNSPSWTESIGHVLLKDIRLELGGHEIARCTGEWMEIYSEFTMTNEQYETLSALIGRDIDNTYGSSSETIYIPLRFWFTEGPESALLVALQNQEIKMIVTFRALMNVDYLVMNSPSGLIQ